MSDRPPNLYAPADPNHGHKHWNQPRLPGRKVERRQAARAGAFRPYRRVTSKRQNRGFRGHIYQSPGMPMLPDFLRALTQVPTLGRKGGDR